MDWVAIAKVEQPEGILCAFCGKENDNADDCGWWYHGPDGGKPYCLECAKQWPPHDGDR